MLSLPNPEARSGVGNIFPLGPLGSSAVVFPGR